MPLLTIKRFRMVTKPESSFLNNSITKHIDKQSHQTVYVYPQTTILSDILSKPFYRKHFSMIAKKVYVRTLYTKFCIENISKFVYRGYVKIVELYYIYLCCPMNKYRLYFCLHMCLFAEEKEKCNRCTFGCNKLL